jgi:hypothetical protein
MLRHGNRNRNGKRKGKGNGKGKGKRRDRMLADKLGFRFINIEQNIGLFNFPLSRLS